MSVSTSAGGKFFIPRSHLSIAIKELLKLFFKFVLIQLTGFYRVFLEAISISFSPPPANGLRSFATAQEALLEYRRYLPPSSAVNEDDFAPFYSGPRSDDWTEFFGFTDDVPTCVQCGQWFNGSSLAKSRMSAKHHISEFHSRKIFMCPLPCSSHPIPVVSHSEKIMRQHLRSGHRIWARNKEQFFVDLLPPPYNLKPLPLDYSLLNVPFIPLGSYNGFVSLAQKELASPYRVNAFAFFNAETVVEVRREVRSHPISRWLWTGDVAQQDRQNILRAKATTELFDHALDQA